MLSDSHLLKDDCSDSELVVLAKKGNSDAFNTLVGRYMPVLRTGAKRYSGVYGMDREDLIQEGMITLFRAVKSYNAALDNKFSTYAITCINNSMNSTVKKHMKNTSPDVTVWEKGLTEQRFISANPYKDQVGDMYLDMESASVRELKIETLLSDFERRVLKLYLQGYSYQQSSTILSASSKAIDNALQRVRRKLRSEN